jgi:rhamnose transport system permease protein
VKRAALGSQAGRQLVLVVLLVGLMAYFGLRLPSFGTLENLQSVLRNLVEVGLIALPMTYVIVTAGIDLSVGSIVGLTAVVLGQAWHSWRIELVPAVLLALCVSTAGGALNGAMIGFGRVPALVATLGTMAIYRGLALAISRAEPVSDFPLGFGSLGNGYVGPIPLQVLLFVPLALGFAIYLARTKGGRALYALGAKEPAAHLSGVPVAWAKLWVYSSAGLVSGLAAIIFVSRVSTAKADAGLGMEMDAIAAVILGGASVAGGEGTILGTLLGLALIAVVRNGLLLSDLGSEPQSVVIGALLIGAVLLDRLLHRGTE